MRAGQVDPVGGDDALMRIIAAEELVDTLAGVDDVGVLFDRLTAQRERNGGGVAQRLPHLVDDLGDALKVLFGGDGLDAEALV